MKRTALLLSAFLLGSLLAVPPAAASAAAPAKVAVTKVKAGPRSYSGTCPTTVGFSAVLVGKGSVRYRWVRGDGSKGKTKTIRLNGKATVRDRQTFDRSIRGWQAVQIAGQKGLSKKAHFTVDCETTYDTAAPLPQGTAGQPTVAAAHVTASTSGTTCPVTVTFTGTIQVSHTPARIAYRWIDSAAGQSRVEYADFPAGAPRSKTVTSTLGVSATGTGWRAIDLLGTGHDSGRATYTVTCATPPPAGQEYGVAITELTPGDHTGSCAEPVAYQATGVITRKAGTAATINYHWVRDGQAGDEQTATFTNGTATVTLAWHHAGREEKAGTRHTVELRLAGGKGTATKTYTFTCKDAPEAQVRISELQADSYNGFCTTPPQLKASAQLQAAQAGTVEYHWVVDGQAGPKKTQVFQNPGAARVDHVWSSVKPGKVELVVDSHDKPRAETLYKVVCSTENPDPDPVVSIGEITSTDIYGVECPSDSGRVWADVQADRDTEIKLFWTVDGRQVATQTVALTAGRPKRVGAVIRAETTRDVPVVLEVLSFNKPKKSATLKVLCTTVKITDVKASPAEYAGPCKSAPGDTIKLSAVLESDRAQTVKYQWVNGAGVVLRNQTFERVFTKRGSATVEVYLTTRVTSRDTYRVRLVSPQAGYQSEAVSFSHVCANAEITQSHVKKDSVRTWCTGEQIPYVMTATIKTESAGTVQWRWVRKSNRTGNQWVAEPWQLTVFNEPGHENVVYNWGTSASEQGDWRLELNAPWSVTSRDHTFTTCLDRN